MNCTICIGHRASTPDRETNLLAVLRYYKKLLPSVKVIIVEQSNCDTVSKKLPDNATYVLAINRESYNRGWGLNIAAQHADTDVIVTSDNDVILQPETFVKAYNTLNDVQFYRPYYDFMDFSAEMTFDFIQHLEIRWPDTEMKRRISHSDQTAAGCMFANRKEFLRVGGYNEEFRGWGIEDQEFLHRISQLSTVKANHVSGNLYHLYHERTIDCTGNHANYMKNVQLYEKIKTIIATDLRTIQIAAIGDLYKYRNEQ